MHERSLQHRSSVPLLSARSAPLRQHRRQSFPSADNAAASTLQGFEGIPPCSHAPVSIQPKLRINTPGDPFEQEADAVADRVMRMSEETMAPALTPNDNDGTLRRLCSECEEEREHSDGKGGSETDEIDGRLASAIQTIRGGGSPLPQSTRNFFSPRFGHDFSDVRVHTDARAEQLAEAVNARAFTLGTDIVFGRNAYAPETNDGKRLLAHELTHVAQQGGAQSHIQRLTVTEHNKTQGTCGERNVQWVFSLDSPAPEDGYIVQQVDKYEFVMNCPGVAIGPPAPIHTFWEAWFVKKGDKVDWTTTRDKWTDGNTRPPRPNTNGSDIAAGTIKFFTKSTTGDLGDFGVAPAGPTSAWGPGKVSNSGALPSTPTKPSWWSGTPDEGPAERGVWAWWNCCDADKTKHTFTLKTKP